MKKLLTAFSLLLIAASINFAQIVITPKKTVYTRKGKDIEKYKKTFVITYPVVSGAITLANKKKLENTISYWRVFETTLQENQTDNTWLDEFSYKINFNKNGILDIALHQEGSAAYPDQSTIELIIDLKTGKQIKFGDAFKTAALAEFAGMVNTKLEAEKKQIIKSIEEDKSGDNDKEQKDSLKEQVGALSFTAESFDAFSVSDKGVTIIYDAGFPHVIQALQPDGEYFFTWSQLKPFIKPDGLLGKFIR